MSTWIDAQDQAKVEKDLATVREHADRYEHITRHAGGDERFALWLIYVNKHVARLTGAGVFDLEDWESREAFDMGLTPRQGAQSALEGDDLYVAFVNS